MTAGLTGLPTQPACEILPKHLEACADYCAGGRRVVECWWAVAVTELYLARTITL